MRVDGPLVTPALAVAGAARAMEAAGYDGAFTFEGPHDPFLPLVVAADATQRPRRRACGSWCWPPGHLATWNDRVPLRFEGEHYTRATAGSRRGR